MPLVPGDVNRVPPGATQLIIKCKFTKTSRELNNNYLVWICYPRSTNGAGLAFTSRWSATRILWISSFAVTGTNPTSTFPQFNVDKIDIEINAQPGCVGN